MNPEDRVVVGVVNRKRDLKHIQEDHWYRIPLHRMKAGVHAEYLAFFLSGRVFKELSGGVRYFARVRGVELAYRRDLLPNEADHPRANDTYYRIGLGEIEEKQPPVLNPTKRTITFIHTTWDRFVHAQTIHDLYSEADYYVDRIYHALRSRGIHSEQHWEADQYVIPTAPGLTIMCENGVLNVSAQRGQGNFFLDTSAPEDTILKAIRERITQHGGPLTINIPVD